MTATRSYFERHAPAVERRYAKRTLLRAGPANALEHAVAVARRHLAPSVLDVGCGAGRVGAAVIDAGARLYVGIDLSARMLDVARSRLPQGVELYEGDFLDLDIARTFDVVLALGLFEYLEEPRRAAEWLRARCSSTLVASFTKWDWIKSPLRRIHYGLHGCRVHDYDEAGAEVVLRSGGFANVEVVQGGRRGFVVEATP
jgi:SAM-dependent methyltransferase